MWTSGKREDYGWAMQEKEEGLPWALSSTMC